MILGEGEGARWSDNNHRSWKSYVGAEVPDNAELFSVLAIKDVPEGSYFFRFPWDDEGWVVVDERITLEWLRDTMAVNVGMLIQSVSTGRMVMLVDTDKHHKVYVRKVS